MNISNLTEDCILHVLSKLSLQESLYARFVCPYWKYLIEHYHYRPLKSLKLFGNDYDVEKYCQLVVKHDFNNDSNFILTSRNHLVLSSIQSYLISSTLLFELFPNVSCLVYINLSCRLSKQVDLNHLLEKWSTNIETLILDRPAFRLQPSVYPALKSFYNFDDNFEYCDKFVSSVLPQLENIFLNIESLHNKLGRQWTILDGKMLNFQALRQLKLKVYESTNFVDYFLNRMDLIVVQNITHFELDHYMLRRVSIEDATKALNLIRKNFPNLEFFRTILFSAIPIEQIIAELVHFPNLKELSVDLELNSSQWLRESNLNLAQLKPIRKLNLIFKCPLFHLNRLAESIQHLFPNLKMLTIDCGYYFDAKRLFEEAFQDCLFKFKMIKYRSNGTLDLSNIFK